MTATVLITGGYGFLGRAMALRFRREGFRVLGIGRGRWAPEEAQQHGFDVWLDSGVDLASLMTMTEPLDLVIHCAGNGSVGYSLANPLQDYHKTVSGTASIAEYLRLTRSRALLIYPSSAGVYGAKPDFPIVESAAREPISPYGYTKRMAEDLLESYHRSYGLRISIVRFFSIYGPGLTKQLLWDASHKLRSADGGVAEFWGTGEETRDWISSEDCAALALAIYARGDDCSLLNGASGVRTTVGRTLTLLRDALGVDAVIRFNQQVREGDPRFYHADVSRSLALGWNPTQGVDEGIHRYARWFLSERMDGRN